MEATVEEIYEPIDGDEKNIPIVLIHDGGGTTFQYYMLGYLGRRTYAIANPYFQGGTRPDGGIAELAKAYAKAIEQEIVSGPIILGGWSLGGMISLETAKVLGETGSRIKVTGLLMIDSYCPWSAATKKGGKIEPSFRETTSERMKELTRASFAHAVAMISSWEQPTGFSPPPVILIRAEESRFKDAGEDDGRLGWTAYSDMQIKQVVDVPGDHFSMFSDEKLDSLTDKLKWSCSQF